MSPNERIMCRPGFGSSSSSLLRWPSLATLAGDASPGSRAPADFVSLVVRRTLLGAPPWTGAGAVISDAPSHESSGVTVVRSTSHRRISGPKSRRREAWLGGLGRTGRFWREAPVVDRVGQPGRRSDRDRRDRFVSGSSPPVHPPGRSARAAAKEALVRSRRLCSRGVPKPQRHRPRRPGPAPLQKARTERRRPHRRL
jgi:hypothetical protein